MVSFNGRNGVVVLTTADVTGAGGAPINSPTFTGVPQGPTAAPGTNSTELATTAFVTAAISGTANVSSFNSRTGAITLIGADVSAAGGALLNSPALTGNPTAPTAAPGDSDTSIATTAFVANAITAAGGVSSFNTRTGAIVLNTTDVTNAGGAPLASPTFTGTPAAPTAAPGTTSTQLATTAFVQAAVTAAGGVSSFNSRTGAVTLTLADITAASGQRVTAVSSTTPGSPTSGNLWWNTSSSQLEVYDGTVWQIPAAAAAVTYSSSVFSTPGPATYTTPSNSTTATVYRVRLQAGGGGGGGYAASATNYPGAGGGGEFCEGNLTGIAASTAVTLSIGGGGNGGAASGGGNGQAGTATTLAVGAISLSVNGGALGTGVSGSGTGTSGRGGQGGTTASTGGWTLLRDMNGQAGSPFPGGAVMPFGGASGLGLGGQGGGTAANYGPSGYGGGGTTQNAGGTTAAAGQAGGGGAVIIERIAG